MIFKRIQVYSIEEMGVDHRYPYLVLRERESISKSFSRNII